MKKTFLLLLLLFFCTPAFTQVTWIYGSYTGTGSTYTESGLPFQPDAIIIKSSSSSRAYIKTSTMGSTASRAFSANTSMVTNAITGITSDGFVLGPNTNVNNSGTTYYFMAFKGSPTVKVGSYTGNGVEIRNISSGFTALSKFTIIIPESGYGGSCYYTSNGTNAGYTYDPRDGASALASESSSGTPSAPPANGFNAYNSTIFSNVNSVVYHYIAFMQTAGTSTIGRYVSNGTDNTNNTSVGFQPKFMLIAGFGEIVMRTANLSGDVSQYFYANTNASNLIQSFSATGFQIGSNSDVNYGSSWAYYYLAMGGSSGGALPVEFLSFDVQCKEEEVDITWATASEVNNDYFTIERSTNGVDFSSITRVKGAGNSNKQIEYQYSDSYPVAGKINYYRIRQTDFDGKSETFHILAANCRQNTKDTLSIFLLQNPLTQDQLKYDLNVPADGFVYTDILTITGQVIKHESVFLRHGMNNCTMDVSQLPAGIYFLRVSDNLNTQICKFMRAN